MIKMDDVIHGSNIPITCGCLQKIAGKYIDLPAHYIPQTAYNVMDIAEME
jgi:hypothetical protein